VYIRDADIMQLGYELYCYDGFTDTAMDLAHPTRLVASYNSKRRSIVRYYLSPASAAPGFLSY